MSDPLLAERSPGWPEPASDRPCGCGGGHAAPEGLAGVEDRLAALEQQVTNLGLVAGQLVGLLAPVAQVVTAFKSGGYRAVRQLRKGG